MKLRNAQVQTMVQSDEVVTVTEGQVPVIAIMSEPISRFNMMVAVNFLRSGFCPAVQLVANIQNGWKSRQDLMNVTHDLFASVSLPGETFLFQFDEPGKNVLTVKRTLKTENLGELVIDDPSDTGHGRR